MLSPDRLRHPPDAPSFPAPHHFRFPTVAANKVHPWRLAPRFGLRGVPTLLGWDSSKGAAVRRLDEAGVAIRSTPSCLRRNTMVDDWARRGHQRIATTSPPPLCPSMIAHFIQKHGPSAGVKCKNCVVRFRFERHRDLQGVHWNV